MSTEYPSNILYDDLLNNLKDIEIQVPQHPLYIIPHKRLYLKPNYIWVFKNDNNLATFERFGKNNPTAIFNEILKQFKDSQIVEEFSFLPWPECGGYGDPDKEGT